MIKRSYPAPSLKLEISAGTIVKVTVAVMATRFAVHVISDVTAPYAERLTKVMKRRIKKLEEENEEKQPA